MTATCVHIEMTGEVNFKGERITASVIESSIDGSNADKDYDLYGYDMRALIETIEQLVPNGEWFDYDQYFGKTYAKNEAAKLA